MRKSNIFNESYFCSDYTVQLKKDVAVAFRK